MLAIERQLNDLPEVAYDQRSIGIILTKQDRLGVTEWAAADHDLATVAKRADESLYRAKQSGHNRVELGAAAGVLANI
jgi:PleD family two-component response regulator